MEQYYYPSTQPYFTTSQKPPLNDLRQKLLSESTRLTTQSQRRDLMESAKMQLNGFVASLSQQQSEQLKQIMGQQQPYTIPSQPISKDNGIVFINHGSFIRHPSERKTAPPPQYGEDEHAGYNPREPFYDPRTDPYVTSPSQRALHTKRQFKLVGQHQHRVEPRNDRMPESIRYSGSVIENQGGSLLEVIPEQVQKPKQHQHSKEFFKNGQLNFFEANLRSNIDNKVSGVTRYAKTNQHRREQSMIEQKSPLQSIQAISVPKQVSPQKSQVSFIRTSGFQKLLGSK
ncbi:hypothetical protein FGO68_gene17127 [Halteria grandinella]|uniref:Uncharacterized protein n=1 Tax=Halteria grandinella TaxID=5974 RepID=A0A8J8NDK5_HALGN|nr:hypothetical protein FGO68_gene17127 [Halteria grandinella]